MIELKDKELMDIKGGTNYLTSAFIGSLVKAGDMLIELGRSLGTAIRRIFSGNVCPF